MSLLLALAAILAQPTQPPAAFVAVVIGECRPVASADFVGCEARADDGETWYAGLRWIDGRATLETGP